MKKINSIDFSQFKNNEHAQFHSDVKNEIVSVTPVKLGINVIFPAYTNALLAELAAIEVESGSKLTKNVEEGDTFRDQIYWSFVLQTKSNLLHYDMNVQTAATVIMRVIDQVGDMRKQNYNQESVSVSSLVNQLKGNYLQEITKCNSLEIVNKLEEANNAFINQFGSRTSEESTRISGDVRLARIPVDKSFHDITNVINAMVLVNGEADYASFIDKVNYLIDYHKNTIKMRKGRKGGASSSESDTPAV